MKFIKHFKTVIENNKNKEMSFDEGKAIRAIFDKSDYKGNNIIVHTVFCGGITYIQIGKKQVMSVSRNFQKETVGIVISENDLTEKNKPIIYEIIRCILDISRTEESEILKNDIKPDQFGIYRIKTGEIEFA